MQSGTQGDFDGESLLLATRQVVQLFVLKPMRDDWVRLRFGHVAPWRKLEILNLGQVGKPSKFTQVKAACFLVGYVLHEVMGIQSCSIHREVTAELVRVMVKVLLSHMFPKQSTAREALRNAEVKKRQYRQKVNVQKRVELARQAQAVETGQHGQHQRSDTDTVTQ